MFVSIPRTPLRFPIDDSKMASCPANANRHAHMMQSGNHWRTSHRNKGGRQAFISTSSLTL
jgi:hypothetical protein